MNFTISLTADKSSFSIEEISSPTSTAIIIAELIQSLEHVITHPGTVCSALPVQFLLIHAPRPLTNTASIVLSIYKNLLTTIDQKELSLEETLSILKIHRTVRDMAENLDNPLRDILHQRTPSRNTLYAAYTQASPLILSDISLVAPSTSSAFYSLDASSFTSIEDFLIETETMPTEPPKEPLELLDSTTLSRWLEEPGVFLSDIGLPTPSLSQDLDFFLLPDLSPTQVPINSENSLQIEGSSFSHSLNPMITQSSSPIQTQKKLSTDDLMISDDEETSTTTPAPEIDISAIIPKESPKTSSQDTRKRPHSLISSDIALPYSKSSLSIIAPQKLLSSPSLSIFTIDSHYKPAHIVSIRPCNPPHRQRYQTDDLSTNQPHFFLETARNRIKQLMKMINNSYPGYLEGGAFSLQMPSEWLPAEHQSSKKTTILFPTQPLLYWVLAGLLRYSIDACYHFANQHLLFKKTHISLDNLHEQVNELINSLQETYQSCIEHCNEKPILSAPMPNPLLPQSTDSQKTSAVDDEKIFTPLTQKITPTTPIDIFSFIPNIFTINAKGTIPTMHIKPYATTCKYADKAMPLGVIDSIAYHSKKIIIFLDKCSESPPTNLIFSTDLCPPESKPSTVTHMLPSKDPLTYWAIATALTYNLELISYYYQKLPYAIEKKSAHITKIKSIDAAIIRCKTMYKNVTNQKPWPSASPNPLLTSFVPITVQEAVEKFAPSPSKKQRFSFSKNLLETTNAALQKKSTSWCIPFTREIGNLNDPACLEPMWYNIPIFVISNTGTKKIMPIVTGIRKRRGASVLSCLLEEAFNRMQQVITLVENYLNNEPSFSQTLEIPHNIMPKEYTSAHPYALTHSLNSDNPWLYFALAAMLYYSAETLTACFNNHLKNSSITSNPTRSISLLKKHFLTKQEILKVYIKKCQNHYNQMTHYSTFPPFNEVNPLFAFHRSLITKTKGKPQVYLKDSDIINLNDPACSDPLWTVIPLFVINRQYTQQKIIFQNSSIGRKKASSSKISCLLDTGFRKIKNTVQVITCYLENIETTPFALEITHHLMPKEYLSSLPSGPSGRSEKSLVPSTSPWLLWALAAMLHYAQGSLISCYNNHLKNDPEAYLRRRNLSLIMRKLIGRRDFIKNCEEKCKKAFLRQYPQETFIPFDTLNPLLSLQSSSIKVDSSPRTTSDSFSSEEESSEEESSEEESLTL